MKKLYILALSLVCAPSLFAQISYDLEIELASPAAGSTVEGTAAYTFNFNLTNNGPDDIPSGDTLWFSYAIETTVYSLAGVQNGASGIILPAAFPSGFTLTPAMLGDVVVDLDHLTGDSSVCIIIWGVNGAIDLPEDPNDTDNTNNISCFTATPPTSSVGEMALELSVYPNPANDVLNFKGSEEVASSVVLSMDGKVVANGTGSSVNVSNLNTGMYIYEVTTVNGTVSRDTFMKK